jgi:esterase
MRLYARKMGEGPALVILHGLYGSSDNWLTIAKSLATNYAVLLPDLRNHGRSAHDYAMNYDNMSEDVIEMLDELSIEKAVIMGHSMGGKVAMTIALNWPERVDKLVVVDIAPVSYLSKEASPEAGTDHAKIIYALRSLDTSSLKSRAEADKRLSYSIPHTGTRQFLLKNLHKAVSGEYAWRINIKSIEDNLKAIMDNICLKSKERDCETQSFPVLFIRGEASKYVAEMHYPAIKKIFPKSTITTLFDAGHWLHAEQPEAFLEVLKDFLKEA